MKSFCCIFLPAFPEPCWLTMGFSTHLGARPDMGSAGSTVRPQLPFAVSCRVTAPDLPKSRRAGNDTAAWFLPVRPVTMSYWLRFKCRTSIGGGRAIMVCFVFVDGIFCFGEIFTPGTFGEKLSSSIACSRAVRRFCISSLVDSWRAGDGVSDSAGGSRKCLSLLQRDKSVHLSQSTSRIFSIAVNSDRHSSREQFHLHDDLAKLKYKNHRDTYLGR